MPLTQERKQELITQFGKGTEDTGRTELTDHLRTHSKDHHSRRGLLMLVGRRRRFLDYLQRTDLDRYRSLIGELRLRR